jgi:glycosyltransferase involved in cell wall biosynthesis
MKILAVSHTGNLGGAENIFVLIVKGLLSKGEHDVYCLLPKEGPLSFRLEEIGAKIIYRDLIWWVRIGRALFIRYSRGFKKRVNDIVDIIAEKKIDLVITNTITIGEAAVAARIAGVPHVWRIAEMLDTDPSLKAPCDLAYFYKIVNFLSTKIIVVSEAVKQEIERFIGASDKVEVVYDGLEVSSLPVRRMGVGDERTVLCVGHICKRKGISVLLEAASIVTKHRPKVKFLVAGAISESEYHEDLLKTRHRLHLDKSFEILGFRNDIPELMNNCDIFVLPSLSEPFGVVILEAMRSGIPVITTTAGGTAEGVVDDVTGYVVPPGDPKSLADRIERLLSNSLEAQAMGQRGFERLQKVFTYANMIAGSEKVLREAYNTWHSLEPSVTISLVDIVGFVDSLSLGEDILREALYYRDLVCKSLLYRCYKKIKNFILRIPPQK